MREDIRIKGGIEKVGNMRTCFLLTFFIELLLIRTLLSSFFVRRHLESEEESVGKKKAGNVMNERVRVRV